MIWIYIILLILLSLLMWLLLAPLYIRINTQQNIYNAGLKGIVKISIIPDEDEIIYLRLKLFFYYTNIYPLKPKEAKREKKEKPKMKAQKKKKKGSKISLFKLVYKLVVNVLGSFKVKILAINIDTDDVITNAYLIPIFVGINTKKNINFTVNYQGDISAEFDVQNNIFRILRIALSTYLKHKKIL